MKIKFKFFEMSISKENQISWVIGQNQFDISTNNWDFFISEAVNGGVIIIDALNIIYFDYNSLLLKEIYKADYELFLLHSDDKLLYISDNTKLICISSTGVIIWIYWHYEKIDSIKIIDKNFLSIRPYFSEEIIIDRKNGIMITSA